MNEPIVKVDEVLEAIARKLSGIDQVQRHGRPHMMRQAAIAGYNAAMRAAVAEKSQNDRLRTRLAAAEARVAELEGLLEAVRKQRQARLAMSIVHGDPKDKGVYEFFAAVWETETLWAALDRERKGGAR